MSTRLEAIVQFEKEVWQALVDGAADVDEHLLAEDFVGVYPTGFAGRIDHVGQLAAGPTVGRYELSEVRTIVVADDAILVLYRADYTRAGRSDAPAAQPESMYVSSLWCERDGKWLNVFSQDTPATGIEVV